MRMDELSRARDAIFHHEFPSALFHLEQARRVAVAQRKLDELVEVRELVGIVSAQSYGSTRGASERMARKVTAGLSGFSSDELVSVGIRPESVGIEPEVDLGALLARWKLSAPAGDPASTRTRELSPARAALDQDEFAEALFLLQEARRVAVAQRKLDELIEVYELVQVLSERSSGRTRAASERLARKVEAGLRSFAHTDTA